MLDRHSLCTAERPGGSNAVERLLAKAAHRVAGRFETAQRNLRSVLAKARHHAAPLAPVPDRLRTMRSGRRERVLAGPLEDHLGLAADVDEAHRAMGRRWIDAGRPA